MTEFLKEGDRCNGVEREVHPAKQLWLFSLAHAWISVTIQSQVGTISFDIGELSLNSLYFTLLRPSSQHRPHQLRTTLFATYFL